MVYRGKTAHDREQMLRSNILPVDVIHLVTGGVVINVHDRRRDLICAGVFLRKRNGFLEAQFVVALDADENGCARVCMSRFSETW